MSPRKAAALRDGEGDRSLREHLIAAAERLMARRGTAGLTVRDIAREARVADGVPYNHVEGKEELLALALPHLFGGGTATALEIPPGFVDELLTVVLKGIGPAPSS